MDQKKIIRNLKALNSAIEDYLDQLDMAGDEKEEKGKKKPEDKED